MIKKVLPDSVEPKKIAGSNVLENLLGVNDSKKLESKEADITFLRTLEILSNPKSIKPYSFDFSHLKAIHRHLFQDIYSWAGKPRSFDMAKSGDIFTPANELEKYNATVFEPSKNLIQLVNSQIEIERNDVVTKLSKSLGLINIYHPFPEGNGRSQRIFISSLAGELAYSINWTEVKKWEMIEVCKRAHEGNYAPMETMIDRILRDDLKR